MPKRQPDKNGKIACSGLFSFSKHLYLQSDRKCYFQRIFQSDFGSLSDPVFFINLSKGGNFKKFWALKINKNRNRSCKSLNFEIFEFWNHELLTNYMNQNKWNKKRKVYLKCQQKMSEMSAFFTFHLVRQHVREKIQIN